MGKFYGIISLAILGRNLIRWILFYIFCLSGFLKNGVKFKKKRPSFWAFFIAVFKAAPAAAEKIILVYSFLSAFTNKLSIY